MRGEGQAKEAPAKRSQAVFLLRLHLLGAHVQMLPGLYDNPKSQRREMWLRGLKGEEVFHGWCHRLALPSAETKWEPSKEFGFFPYPEKG